VVHLDLKWENILWDAKNESIVVSDFDVAVQMHSAEYEEGYRAGTEGMGTTGQTREKERKKE
jgi:hypothetical protein